MLVTFLVCTEYLLKSKAIWIFNLLFGIIKLLRNNLVLHQNELKQISRYVFQFFLNLSFKISTALMITIKH